MRNNALQIIKSRRSCKLKKMIIYRNAVERRINGFPNFIAEVVDEDGSVYPIHFVGLFSRKQKAIPLMCIHGWPGKFTKTECNRGY